MGYDVKDDHYMMEIGEVVRFVSSARGQDKIIEGDQVCSSVLGLNSGSCNEDTVVIDNHGDCSREVSRHSFPLRLQSCLQDFMDRQKIHQIYYTTICSSAMTQ